MYVITISNWKRKLVALVVLVALFIGAGLSLNILSKVQEASVNAPSDQNLQDDVLSQPVKVQAAPESVQPTKPVNVKEK